jgi:hypothetical protein
VHGLWTAAMAASGCTATIAARSTLVAFLTATFTATRLKLLWCCIQGAWRRLLCLLLLCLDVQRLRILLLLLLLLLVMIPMLLLCLPLLV